MIAAIRDQVTELLRCAADDGVGGTAGALVGMFGAVESLDASAAVERIAWAAKDAVDDRCLNERTSGRDENYRAVLLEAAMRVEEGSWP